MIVMNDKEIKNNHTEYYTYSIYNLYHKYIIYIYNMFQMVAKYDMSFMCVAQSMSKDQSL